MPRGFYEMKKVRPGKQHISKKQRAKDVGRPGVTLRPERRKWQMRRARKALIDHVHGAVVVTWVDNYSKRYYKQAPVNREQHVNGTAVSMTRALDIVPAAWVGHPGPVELWHKLPHAVSALLVMQKDFINEMISVIGHRQTSEVRSPCDIRRRGVVAAGWCPFEVMDLNISSTDGMVEVMAYCRRSMVTVGAVQMPVMSDVNIFGRLNKMMLSSTFDQYDVGEGLNKHPLLMGVWHSYVHCLKKVYSAFRSWWSCFEYPLLIHGDVTTSASWPYDHPKVITLEDVVVALAVQGPHFKTRILTALRTARGDVSRVLPNLIAGVPAKL